MEVVIIGNGIAGITAARHIRKKSNHGITVISSETPHFFSRTALMYIYMGHMKFEHTKPYEDWFWVKNKIDLVHDHVVEIHRQSRTVVTESGSKIQYDKLILATGSRSNRLQIPGMDLEGVQGLYSLQDLEAMELNTKGIQNAVVVGGGLIGIEMAEMLHSRNIHVAMLIRENRFWDVVLPKEEADLLGRHIRNHGIDLQVATQLQSINGSEHVESVETDAGGVLSVDFVGVTIGVSPNKALAEQIGLDTDRGILVNEYLLTSDPDIYAIGDCAQLREPSEGRKSIEAVWYTGRMMGKTAASNICDGPLPYNPGLWFNSAKFFDIEYQVYGNVPNKPAPLLKSFYWEEGERCIRLVFESGTHSIVGIHALGIRLRHEIAEKWLTGKKQIGDVVSDLNELNFNPEFFPQFEARVAEAFGKEYPEISVTAPKRSFLNKIFG